MFGPANDAHVMRLVLFGYAHLTKPDQARLPITRRLLYERLDVRETKNRGQRRTRHAPMRALALPVVKSVVLEPRNRRGRRGAVELVELVGIERHRWSDAVFRGRL